MGVAAVSTPTARRRPRRPSHAADPFATALESATRSSRRRRPRPPRSRPAGSEPTRPTRARSPSRARTSETRRPALDRDTTTCIRIETRAPTFRPTAPSRDARRAARNARAPPPSSRSRPPFRSATINRCSSRSPTGISSRPPSASWSSSGCGTDGAPAVTRIASYGAYSRQPMVPSPSRSDTLLHARALNVLARLLEQRRNPLDREHLRHEMREQHRLIARARADLEHALLARELQQLEIARVHPRLRDRLPVADRQRRVLVRAMPQPRRHERVARRHLERAQHGEIANSLLAQRLDEPLPRAAQCSFVATHRSRHHVAAPCSALKCVRSRCSGVTETYPSSIARKSESGSPRPADLPAADPVDLAAPRILHRRDGLRVHAAAETREPHALHLVAGQRRQVDVEQRVGGKRGKRREMPQQRREHRHLRAQLRHDRRAGRRRRTRSRSTARRARVLPSPRRRCRNTARPRPCSGRG